jgi:flagellar hook assembly protein FlgD
MRTTAAYQFTSGTQPRRFQLSLASSASVTLTSVTALATEGGGAQITYALAAPATVSADILNLSGALIRTISTGTLSPAGISTLVWDGRNASGSAVPAGLYLVRLTVDSDSGERTTALRSLSLSR